MTLAFFASGGGSNVGAILDAIADGRLTATPALVVCDRPGAGVLARADAHRISSAVLPPADFVDEDAFAAALLDVLDAHGVDFVALAGYLKKVPAAVVRAFQHRMLNVHPALLPAFGGHGLYGLRVHRAALDYGVKLSGATVHLVDEAYDTGPVVLQEAVPVLPSDTPDTLAARVLAVEHRLFPAALALFADGRVRVSGRRVVVADAAAPQTP